jgi:hypothetical protein
MSSWKALYVASRSEKKVHAFLTEMGLESYLPLKTEKKQWSDRKKMEKEILKSVMSNLKTEDVLSLNFVGEFKTFNGEYKVGKLSRGKGKGGSLLMELVNTSTSEKLESLMISGKKHFIGTPISEYILNVTYDGKMHGSMNESELPRAFERDKESAAKIRELLKPLVGKTTPTKLSIKSLKAPEFNGTWLVKNAKLNAGRHGQVSLQLEDVSDPTRTCELWSYRHSAVLDELEEVI